MLFNLVRNAADAVPDGGRVILWTHRPRLGGLGDQLAIEVSVSHHRMGVPTAGDVFVTARPYDKNTELGLWMVDRFASTHGGTISIETSPEHGITVRLFMPFAGDAELS